jgi:putative transposase
MKFGFVAKHRGIWPAEWLCGALGVSRGGFYAWLTRPRSQRSRSDEELGAKVRASFLASDRTYGARRVWHDMLAEGASCGLHRIERLMRLQALKARPRRRRLPPDLGERQVAAVAPNVLDRSFEAPAPNRKWIADFTYVWTAEGWLYVAAVVDLFSRRVVGWSMNAAMTAQLVTDALVMAIWRRGKPDALLHHSDRGSQGGFKRSSRHLNEGGCDGHSKATITPFWTSAVAVTGTTANSGAICTPAILVGDRAGDYQRGCCIGGWYVPACRNQIVQTGGRHGTSDVQIFDQTAVRAVPLVCGT